MYGASDLCRPRQRAAARLVGRGARRQIFMIGTPNEGSAEAFVTLLEGYSINEGCAVASASSTSSRARTPSPSHRLPLLPHARAARFLDEDLN